MKGSWRIAGLAQAVILVLLASRIVAQVQTGELSTSMSGTISPGYTATYGNMTGSSHSWTIGGATTLSGSFHNPNFLSFNAGLYLNQSRANSNFQSISNASGVNLSSNIFGGSHFPGSISYTKAYNSEGNYSVPGLANFVTHGNSDTFGINWSESIPDAPSFSAGYSLGTSHYTVYGAGDQGKNRFHSLNLHSGYSLDGFNMGAFYTKGDTNSLIPRVVAGQTTAETHSNNDAYGYNISHRLPMKGSGSATFTRSNWNSDYLGFKSSGTIDMVNGQAAIYPRDRLSISGTANWSDNLSGQIYQSVAASGGVVAGLDSNQTSNSLDLMSVATYSTEANLQVQGFVERRSQSWEGVTYGVTSYGGGATYAHALFDGSFNASASATENVADRTGTSTLGFSTNENYSNTIKGWHVNGTFGYAQNVQTLLITYMNSYFNYSGNARRNWGRFNMSVGAGAARTGLTQQAGTVSSSQSYFASMGYGRWLTTNGNYSKSSGQALLTGAGLVSVTVPTPSSLVSLYGGESYSFGVSSTPAKRLILAGAWARATSNTSSQLINSSNKNEQANVLIQYQYRKLYFTSGFARLQQGFSSANNTPEVISSYFVGLSRWFNFF